MNNPTLFDAVYEDEPFEQQLLDLFDRHEKEIVHFLEREYGELSFDEKLAVMLTSCFVRAGHVCMPINKSADELALIIEMDESIIEKIQSKKLRLNESSIVGRPAENTPMILDGRLLYFRRYFRDEKKLLSWITEKGNHQKDIILKQTDREILHDLFESGKKDVNWQKVAAALSLFKPFTFHCLNFTVHKPPLCHFTTSHDFTLLVYTQ